MSQMQPEAQPESGNVFTRKIGPLPMWAWMAIALVLALIFYLYSKNKAASAAQNSGTASTGAASGGVNSPGGVDASLVPQFVNQNYENSTPPAAPNVTVNNTIPQSTATVTQPSAPGYGQAGPANGSYQAITTAQATTLNSANNLYNTAGRAAQRPFIWNGSAYVANTNPISNQYQYYAGPVETKEINTYNAKQKTTAKKLWPTCLWSGLAVPLLLWSRLGSFTRL
jgi:hypothetical protein